MIKKIGFIIGLIAGIIVASCRPIRSTRDSFQFTRYCYDGLYSGLDTTIKTRGYYTFSKTYTANIGYPSKPQITTYQFSCLFFNDGTFIYYFNPEIGDGQWGKYLVKNDTIKAKFIESPGGMSWTSGEIWFKIHDNVTIQELYFKYREPIKLDQVELYQQSKESQKTSLGHFSPYDNLPNPDKSWLKKRKWFWCDQVQYKTWKRGLK